MIGFFINLTFYVSGLAALVVLNFHGVMTLEVNESSHVIALLVTSPFLLWAQAAAYHYLFEGLEIALTRAVDYSADLHASSSDCVEAVSPMRSA